MLEFGEEIIGQLLNHQVGYLQDSNLNHALNDLVIMFEINTNISSNFHNFA